MAITTIQTQARLVGTDVTRNATALTVNEPKPIIHNLRISRDTPDRATGISGVALRRTETGNRVIKHGIDLEELFIDQIGDIIRKNDVFNLTVDSDVILLGGYPAWFGRTNRLSLAPISSEKAFGIQHMIVPIAENAGDMWHFEKHTSAEGWRTHSRTFTFLPNRYGRGYLQIYSWHGTMTTAVSIRHKDTKVVSWSGTFNTNNNWIENLNVTVPKNHEVYITYTYTANSVDSKNEYYLSIMISMLGGRMLPALLIGSGFDQTHTINITNNGAILGLGGDGNNYTPQNGYSDMWNKPLVNQHVDAYVRFCFGTDAIACTDVAAVNIINNGTLSGGGSGAYQTEDGSTLNPNLQSKPGGGGIPYGRGGACQIHYQAQQHEYTVAPNATLTTTSNGGGPYGRRSRLGNGTSENTSYPAEAVGLWYRGSVVPTLTGSGTVYGVNCFSTTAPTY